MTENLNERLKAYATELEEDISEAREGLSGVKVERRSYSREVPPKRFDHAKYELAQRESYFETKISHLETVARKFCKHFPEYKPKPRK